MAGVPSKGRLYELQQEIADEIPKPYVLTSKITIKPPTNAQMRALAIAQTRDDEWKAILGDAYDAVIEAYDDRPFQEWNKFASDVYRHFMGPGADAEGKSENSSD